jgi:SAM-dependent methyltransferase
MLTMPLIKAGFDARGLDLDRESIEYGRRIAALSDIDPARLTCTDLRDVDDVYDVVILSEVLEHQADDDAGELLRLIHSRIRPGGLLLLTVPNGRGWYEFEYFLWARLGLAKLVRWLRLEPVIVTLKRPFIGIYEDAPFPSTIDASPHLQRYSLASIQQEVTRAGFDVGASTGTVLMCGPMSSLLFVGFQPIMRLNGRLGGRWPRVAAGFMLCAIRR